MKVILLLLCLTISNIYANNSLDPILYFESRTRVMDELAATNIKRIIQDREGFLWFGSENGLTRYDGYSFFEIKNSYNSDQVLSNNSIRSMKDGDNDLWVGTQVGLNRVNKHNLRTEIIRGCPFENVVIESIEIADNNSLWLATSKGVFRYFPDENRTISYLPGTDSKSLLLDSKGRLWLTTWGKGLFRYSDSDGVFISYPRLSRNNGAYCLFEDRDNNIWVGTRTSGLVRLVNEDSPKSVKYVKYQHNNKKPNSIGSDVVYTISQDEKNDYIWVGSKYGLSILSDINNPYSFVNHSEIRTDQGRFFGDINSICKDRSGIMWLASLYNGVLKLNPYRPLIKYNPLTRLVTNLKSTMVLSAVQVSPNTICLNMKDNGLFLYNTKTNRYKSMSSLLNKPMLNIDNKRLRKMTYFKESETLYCAYTGFGYIIVKFKNGTPISATIKKAKQPYLNVPRCFIKDSHDNLWIICRSGIEIITSDISVFYKRIGMYTSATADKEGNIWAGSLNNGIHCLSIKDNTVSSLFFNNDILRNIEIISMYTDINNNIWAGTRGKGLFLFDRNKKQFEQVNERFKLTDNIVFNVFGDSDGNIYMCTERGFLNINVVTNSTTVYPNSHFSGNYFDPLSSFYKLSDDIVMLCGTRGINTMHIKQSLYNTYVPTAAITDVKVRGRSIFDSSISHTNYTNKPFDIELPISENEIGFKFSALSFVDPQQNGYAYKLDGFDKDWKYVDASQRYINYTNLQPGKYKFILNVANEQGVWSDKTIEYRVTVLQSIFKTWYAYLCYLSVFIIVCFIGFKIINSRIRLNNLLLATRLQKETVEEVNQLKMKFFTNISHELLTPLSIIRCSIDGMKDSSFEDKKQRTIINSNIDRLMRLIRQVIDFRKAESDNLSLKVSYGNISQFMETICANNFQPLVNEQQIHMSVVAPPSQIWGYIDFDKIDKILYNLLSNAFKYNKTGGFVFVTIKESQDEKGKVCTIIIKDNGIGIDHKNIDSIFERFYEGDYRRQNKLGNGIGLSLTKDLVLLHKGTISVESELGHGTTFTVTIPFEKHAYTSVEIDEIYYEKQEESVGIREKKENVKTVLIVEDNSDLQYVTKLNLSSRYHIMQAYDGLEALEIISNNSIDLIVSDIMMPQMDGFELCEKIKTDINYSHIPLILLTAKNTEEDRALGYSKGADGFISKPFSIEVLKSRILNLITKREQLRSSFKDDEENKVDTITYNPMDKQFMDSIIAFVEQNIGNGDLAIEDISKELCMSKSTMYRKIKSIAGMSPIDLVRNIRLKAAKTMLREQKYLTISEVAFTSGFNDPKYFSSCFKKEFGKTPTQYQNGE